MYFDDNILSENCIIEMQNGVDWIWISRYQKLSEKFIKDYKDNLSFWRVCQYQRLSESFIREFRDRVNWTMISKFQQLSESFIREFRDRVNWIQVSQYQRLSEFFIEEFREKIYWRFLSRNDSQKYYSVKFIFDYAPLFNHYYRYNFAANKIQNYWLPKYYKPGNVGYLKAIHNFKSMVLNQ